MSLSLVEHERRLADVVWSWISVNSPLLSIQRFTNLQERFPAEARRLLSTIARERVRAKDPRWKSLAGGTGTLGERSDKRRAVRPRYQSWATLMLQLRMGLGVGIKADALTFILALSRSGTEWLSVAMIADGLGYTPAAVRRAADDLGQARFIHLLGTAEGEQVAQRMYSGNAPGWATLLGVSVNTPGWGYWSERYLFVLDALDCLEGKNAKTPSAYVRDVKAREVLSRHGFALRKDGIVDPVEFANAEANQDLLASASMKFIAWLNNYG
jgi:hypothetical protein